MSLKSEDILQQMKDEIADVNVWVSKDGEVFEMSELSSLRLDQLIVILRKNIEKRGTAACYGQAHKLESLQRWRAIRDQSDNDINVDSKVESKYTVVLQTDLQNWNEKDLRKIVDGNATVRLSSNMSANTSYFIPVIEPTAPDTTLFTVADASGVSSFLYRHVALKVAENFQEIANAVLEEKTGIRKKMDSPFPGKEGLGELTNLPFYERLTRLLSIEDALTVLLAYRHRYTRHVAWSFANPAQTIGATYGLPNFTQEDERKMYNFIFNWFESHAVAENNVKRIFDEDGNVTDDILSAVFYVTQSTGNRDPLTKSLALDWYRSNEILASMTTTDVCNKMDRVVNGSAVWKYNDITSWIQDGFYFKTGLTYAHILSLSVLPFIEECVKKLRYANVTGVLDTKAMKEINITPVFGVSIDDLLRLEAFFREKSADSTISVEESQVDESFPLTTDDIQEIIACGFIIDPSGVFNEGDSGREFELVFKFNSDVSEGPIELRVLLDFNDNEFSYVTSESSYTSNDIQQFIEVVNSYLKNMSLVHGLKNSNSYYRPFTNNKHSVADKPSRTSTTGDTSDSDPYFESSKRPSGLEFQAVMSSINTVMNSII